MRGAWLACLLGLALAPLPACRSKVPTIDAPFIDDFERGELGASWNATSDQYRTVTAPRAEYRMAGGQLVVSNAYNHPAWLRRKLPHDVVIDVDAMSNSPSGDIKVEIFGDGESFDPDKGSYTSSGYVLIFGGWSNSLSVICRQEEHGSGRKAARSDIRVEPGRSYHFTIKRQGGAIDWAIDGRPFLSWTDPEPLAGVGHDYLAVDDWEAELTFDNLHVRPAP